MVFFSATPWYINLFHSREENRLFRPNACLLIGSTLNDVKKEHSYTPSIGTLVARR